MWGCRNMEINLFRGMQECRDTNPSTTHPTQCSVSAFFERVAIICTLHYFNGIIHLKVHSPLGLGIKATLHMAAIVGLVVYSSVCHLPWH